MSAKLLLRYIGCYRGAGRKALKAQGGRRILGGPLRGCIGLPSGPTVRFGRGYALVFKPVIRIGP